MPHSATCLIAFGANLGDPAGTLHRAAGLMGQQGIRVLATSRLHRTRPAGGPPDQPDFQNGAILAESELSPERIVGSLLQIEHQLGRARDQRWAARTADLDLLMVDDLVLERPEVTLPHPRMTWRTFVLGPAAEVAAEMVHPLSGLTVRQLWQRLERMPRKIAWLDREQKNTIRNRVAETLVDRADLILSGPAPDAESGLVERSDDRWAVLVGRSKQELAEQANSSRLLVWDSGEWHADAAESKWARHFPGAVMDLGRPGLTAEVEFLAAIEAMVTL